MGYSLGLLSGPHDPSTQRVPVAPLPSPRTPTRRSRRSNDNPLLLLLRRTFSSRLTLEKAVRSWATFDAEARSAVQAIDRRRMDYIARRLKASGIAEDIAQARAQILYWAFVGYALSDKPLPTVRQQAVFNELVRIALQN